MEGPLGGNRDKAAKPTAEEIVGDERILANKDFQQDAEGLGLSPEDALEEARAGKDSSLDRGDRITLLNRAQMAAKDDTDLEEARKNLEKL